MNDITGRKVSPGSFVAWHKTYRNTRKLLLAIVIDIETEKYSDTATVEKAVLLSTRDYAGVNNLNLYEDTHQVSSDRIVLIDYIPSRTKKALDQAYNIYWETKEV